MDAWPFVGRDGELAAIERAFGGSDVDAVVVAGPSGVGKTALAREALKRLRAAGCQVEWAAGTRAAASVPFGAVAQLVPADWHPVGGPPGVLRAVAGQVGAGVAAAAWCSGSTTRTCSTTPQRRSSRTWWPSGWRSRC
ncbi:hypothetical protein Pflav_038260 [Phytohabitans flavus]|uniref:Orc1-like AAA ATPase domain-containing protein n=1 Tax=Phytohabitans flavus TaxID=1076124 RepID=A0A6F8XUB1_9ACTN|nr:ATP-binding protein [Phytohabitans flavus]BCB77416.1 hypothetical protein Pflav_038260 [Phytohabitans flavus]